MDNEAESYSKMLLVTETRKRAEKESNKEIKRLKEVARNTLYRWAFWRDGVQYVGSTGTLYAKALAELEKELKGIFD